MANAPQRSLSRPRSERRMPKGPSVPLSPRDRTRRDQLVAASEHLRTAGESELAEAVDYVLGPRGRAFVTRLHQDTHGSPTGQHPNMPILMPTSRRDLINDLAARGAETRTEIVEAAFRRFLAGDFDPQVDPKAPQGAGEDTAVINVRIPKDLRDRVDARCKELRDGKKHHGRALTRTSVAAAALYEWFEVGPYAPQADSK